MSCILRLRRMGEGPLRACVCVFVYAFPSSVCCQTLISILHVHRKTKISIIILHPGIFWGSKPVRVNCSTREGGGG